MDERHEYLARLKPLTNGLFNAAHAIMGNCELAEYVTQAAILDAFLERRKWRQTMGFRDGLMRAVRLRALNELKRQDDIDIDWRGIPKGIDQEPVPDALAEAPLEVQRAVVLRYGCGLSYKQMAAALNRPANELYELVWQNVRRIEGGLRSDRPNQPIERAMTRAARRFINRPGSAAFDPGTMLRAFEQDLEGLRPKRRAVRVAFRYLFVGLGAALCALLFWVLAVLLEG